MEIESFRSSSMNEARAKVRAAFLDRSSDGEASNETSPEGFATEYRDRLKSYLQEDQHSDFELDDLCRPAASNSNDALFKIFTSLLDAEFSESVARSLTDRLRGLISSGSGEPENWSRRLRQIIRDEIEVCGAIQVTPGRCRVAALVGPTGVGKTTTIAKLAANFRLREKRRVGLITVDTYRIAAVEQLRTYADIIDLPMEVVATPREMRDAVARFSNLDVVLIDTAGRSPKDEIQLQELKAMLSEARPDEIHLVLSCVSNVRSLVKAATEFKTVGATALMMTKLDEAVGLGNLLPLFEKSRLPVSYLTHGQNVPNDIQIADRDRIVTSMVGDVCEPNPTPISYKG